MKKLNLGIIGLGSIGSLHLDNGLKLSNAHLVAVSDVSKKALFAAKTAGVKKTYTDYEQLLADKEIDAVVIALPTHLHLQCVRRAADRKKHILLEKPIARDVNEAEAIVSVCRRNSVKLMIGYPLRFNPVFRELKEKIKNGYFGEVESANAIFIGSGPFSERAIDNAPIPVPEWWFDKKLTGGGVLMDYGSHMINLLRWYFGEITNIRSYLSFRFNMDIEDSATCLAKFGSGTDALIQVGWFSQELLTKVELFGTAAIAEGRRAIKGNPLVAIVRSLLTGKSNTQSPYFSELAYFVNCILNDYDPSPSAVDGLKDVKAISLAYRNEINLD